MPAQTAEPPEEKVYYPSFSICGDRVDEFLEEHPLKKGRKFKAVVELELTGWSDDRYDKRISFDVRSIEPKNKGFEEKSSDEQFGELMEDARRHDGEQEEDGGPGKDSYGSG